MYYTLKLVKLQILEQHFQCWCYSYPTSARATSVLTHLINFSQTRVITLLKEMLELNLIRKEKDKIDRRTYKYYKK